MSEDVNVGLYPPTPPSHRGTDYGMPHDYPGIRLPQQSKSSMAQARAELAALAQATTSTARGVKVRVYGMLRVVDLEWVEVKLFVKLAKGKPALNLTHPDHPMLVARQYSGVNGEREARELYITLALRRILEAHGASVVELEQKGEPRIGKGTEEYRYWASVGAPFGVALQTQPDGTVVLVPLG